MNVLWEDMLKHLFSNNMNLSASSTALRRFFLGTIVIDSRDEENYLVDGQQRFTTLTIISAALRDALISTGHIAQAQIVQEYMITSNQHVDKDDQRNRFELLDNPPGNWLSSEVGLRGYRKRIAPIPLSLFTRETKAGSNKLLIDVDKSEKTPWSVPTEAGWSFSLSSDDAASGISTQQFKVPPGDDGALFTGNNPPAEILLSSILVEDIPDGLELVLLPELKWPGEMLVYPSNATARAFLNYEKGMNKCDLFEPQRRDFYFEVRRIAEHYILGRKTMITSNQFVQIGQGSIVLNTHDKGDHSLINWLGRLPGKNEEIVFEKSIPVAPKNDIPEEDELKEIIRHQQEVKGSEGSTLELKATIRYNLAQRKHEDTEARITIKKWKKLEQPEKGKYKLIKKDPIIEHMCIKTIAAFLNTYGGGLIVGVRDNGQIKGIEIDNLTDSFGEFSADWVERHIIQLVRRDLGNVAATLVVPKVVMIDGLPVLYVHVKKWNSSDPPPDCKAPGGNDKFYVRQGSITVALEDEDKEKHINAHFGDDAEPEPVLVPITRRFKVSDSTNNWGRPKVFGEVIGDEPILPRSTCSISFHTEGVSWPDHLDEPKKRAKQLTNLVHRVIFSRISFESEPAAALDHFMLTNDASRMDTLSVYDMASAFTQKIIRPTEPDGQMNLNQVSIQQSWFELSNRIYISLKKDVASIETFFYYFLMASMKWKTGHQRWTKKDSWIGMQRSIDNFTSEDGVFDYSEIEDLYKEMNHYSKAFRAAWDPDSFDWYSAPYDAASCRDERTYLKMLSKSNIRQHIPAYMAMSYACENKDPDSRSKIINGFLKNWVYIYLRYRTLAKLHPKVSSGWTDTTLYGLQIGNEKWIGKIHSSIGGTGGKTSDDDIEQIQKFPLMLEPDEQDLWPWEENHAFWPDLSVGIPTKKPQITTMLYAFERASEGQTNPTMSRLHKPSKPQLEHVLPEDPKEWGYPWHHQNKKTKSHAKWVGALGNHVLLEDSKNSHVGNLIFKKKIPKGGCDPCLSGKDNNHYEGTAYISAKQVIEYHGTGGKWTTAAITEHSTKIMNTIVEFFSGST